MGGREAAWETEQARTVSSQEDKSLNQGKDVVMKKSLSVGKVHDYFYKHPSMVVRHQRWKVMRYSY